MNEQLPFCLPSEKSKVIPVSELSGQEACWALIDRSRKPSESLALLQRAQEKSKWHARQAAIFVLRGRDSAYGSDKDLISLAEEILSEGP